MDSLSLHMIPGVRQHSLDPYHYTSCRVEGEGGEEKLGYRKRCRYVLMV